MNTAEAENGYGAAPDAPASRTAQVHPLAAGALGFLVGVVFWHGVGFWGLVHDAMFVHRRDEVAAANTRPAATAFATAPGRLMSAASALAPTSVHCTEAVAGAEPLAVVRDCDAEGRKFLPARGVEPADFADFGPDPVPTILNTSALSGETTEPAVGGWSAQIDTSTGPPSASTTGPGVRAPIERAQKPK